MEDIWQRLETWGKAAGAGSLKLRPPATEEDIRGAEATFGRAFPKDFREHLACHDGQESKPDVSWMPGCSPLQPLHAMVARWKEERGMDEDERKVDEESKDGRHKLCLWHPDRIPIAGSPWWDGDNTYLDFHPGKSGVPGQVITFTTECDLAVLGESFRAAVEKYVLLCERGKLIWNAELREAVPAKDGRWNGNPAGRIAKMKVGRR